MRDITITIQIPALSALISYLEGQQQQEIDALTKQVADLTANLKQSSDRLDTQVHAHPTRT